MSNQLEIISREEAQRLRLNRYFTGDQCKHGHICERYTSCARCVLCDVASRKKKNRKPIDTEKKREENRRYREKYEKRFGKKYAEDRKVWDKKYRTEKREQYLAAKRRHKKKFPGKVAAINAKTRSARMKRVPQWLTKEHFTAIQSIYDEARRLTQETGIPHHVDHIHPLQGRTVSGLHVPWNLQVLPAIENVRKGNSF